MLTHPGFFETINYSCFSQLSREKYDELEKSEKKVTVGDSTDKKIENALYSDNDIE